ncbi:MAG: PaaI family thioesterase [Bacteroidota bacterium]
MNPILQLYNHINHFGNDHNMTYEVVEPGMVTYRMTIEERHLSGPGVAHGGIIAGFMDAVLGVAALSLAVEEGNLVSTVEFKINYLRPVKLGETITGTGKVDSRGQRILVSSGEIRDSRGELLAKAMGTFNAYPAEKIRDKVGGLL